MYLTPHKLINALVRPTKENIIIELYHVDLFFITDLIPSTILTFSDFSYGSVSTLNPYSFGVSLTIIYIKHPITTPIIPINKNEFLQPTSSDKNTSGKVARTPPKFPTNENLAVAEANSDLLNHLP